jgi:hypothetical protein
LRVVSTRFFATMKVLEILSLTISMSACKQITHMVCWSESPNSNSFRVSPHKQTHEHVSLLKFSLNFFFHRNWIWWLGANAAVELSVRRYLLGLLLCRFNTLVGSRRW